MHTALSTLLFASSALAGVTIPIQCPITTTSTAYSTKYSTVTAYSTVTKNGTTAVSTKTATQSYTSTVTLTTTATPATISGYNVTDNNNCLDGRIYNPSGTTDLYVEVCNVAYDGSDIGAGEAGDEQTDLPGCANLCEQFPNCVAALGVKDSFASTGFACFLKSNVTQTRFAQGSDLIFKLKAQS